MPCIEPGKALIYILPNIICLSHWFEWIPFQSKRDHDIPGESFVQRGQAITEFLLK